VAKLLAINGNGKTLFVNVISFEIGLCAAIQDLRDG